MFHKKLSRSGFSKSKRVSRKKWKVCENTHERIVSKELFELKVNRYRS